MRPWLLPSLFVNAKAGVPPWLRAFATLLFVSCSHNTGEDATPPTSAQCIECHPAEAKAWRGSMHDQAMQPATPEAVLGDFEAPPLTWVRGTSSQVASFRRDQDRFVVRIENEDGQPTDFTVAYTLGVAPLQQYLTPAPGGRLQCLPVAWDTERRRWFHLDPDPPPGDAFHWTGRYQTWNIMCAECHSTGLVKGYDPASDSYTTTWSELDVACTACHAMDPEHVRAAQPGQDARLGELEACAPCHSRRTTLTGEGSPDAVFLENFEPALLRPGLYFPDGQIHDEVYVWGSFVQSRMSAAGVTCSDCHDPHSLQLKLPEGPGHNELCLQCHSESPPRERFPTLPARNYDTPGHHHHEPGSEAARCTTCHMPTRTYMQVDARRDHRMGVPRPELSAELGTPDVCEGCHEGERGPEWAAAAIETWRGEAGPEARRSGLRREVEARISRGLAALWQGEVGDVGGLIDLTSSSELTDFQRASLVEALASLPLDLRSELAALEADPAALVSATARRELLLRGAPPSAEEERKRDASGDYNADFPATWLNRSQVAQRRGQLDLAEEDLRRALKLDPDFLPAVHNLAVLLAGRGRAAQARGVLESALMRHPDDGELTYSLGLVCAELGDLPAACEALGRAARLMPERPRVAYNHGLALMRLEHPLEAEAELRRGLSLLDPEPSAPGTVELTSALMGLLIQAGRIDEAKALRDSVAKRDPVLGRQLTRLFPPR